MEKFMCTCAYQCCWTKLYIQSLHEIMINWFLLIYTPSKVWSCVGLKPVFFLAYSTSKLTIMLYQKIQEEREKKKI